MTSIPSTPALDRLCRRAADLMSVRKAFAELVDAGQLGQLERDVGALRKSIAGGARFVRDASGGPVLTSLAKSTGGTGNRRERDEVLAKSFQAGQLARQMTNPADAALAAELAADSRAQALGRAGHLAKAAEYRRMAGRVSDPAQAEAYERLARREEATV